MKNKISDLNNHLFAAIERLNDEELDGEELTREINRARAITLVSREIIDNGRLALAAAQAICEGKLYGHTPPEMLRITDETESK